MTQEPASNEKENCRSGLRNGSFSVKLLDDHAAAGFTFDEVAVFDL